VAICRINTRNETVYIKIPCGIVNLEAELFLPDIDYPSPAVVICHPHPLYGGDMHNNVVTAIYDALKSDSIAALRFNFRGVGSSGGTYNGGVAEKDDLKAVFDYLGKRPEIDNRRFGLAGYSFGGAVAFNFTCEDKRVRALSLVSPMLQDSEWSQLRKLALPKLVLVGDEDSVIPIEVLNNLSNEDKGYIKIAGANHFWHGFEEQLQFYTVDFFKQSLYDRKDLL
jgi:alpha/beta superfamily hydrolase